MRRVSGSKQCGPQESDWLGLSSSPDLIGRDEGKDAGGIVLGTEVPGVGFKLL